MSPGPSQPKKSWEEIVKELATEKDMGRTIELAKQLREVLMGKPSSPETPSAESERKRSTELARLLSGNDPIDGCSKRDHTIYNVIPTKQRSGAERFDSDLERSAFAPY